MRFEAPLILGAGPAGCAAALALAQQGVRPRVLERQRTTGDALCGGFLSWATLKRLETLGVEGLGGHPVARVRVFAGSRTAEARLPAGAAGVSRHRLDTVMQAAFERAGGSIERGVTVKSHENGALAIEDGMIRPESLFLATGKYDLRGLARPRGEAETAIGLRVRMPANPALSALVGDAIELHLFDGGYAGLLLQEDGSANLCLATRKDRLTQAGGDPAALLGAIGTECPPLGARLAFLAAAPIDAIAAVPYGWRAKTSDAGIFRLGDQAAVIPSLAGEGIGIAVASGMAAADAWARGGPDAAPDYQKGFARRTARPVAAARLLWHQGERPASAALATRALAIAPFLARFAARWTRIGD